MPMAKHPYVFGPLLVLSMVSVIYGYLRTTRLGEPKLAPVPKAAEPQPEMV
ncbi:Inositol phosphorylceramide synthase OS=Streptomyces alboniger OX=132473 GN=CP975_28830 PE=4 SV=1 [Streptomyces alboniger]